MSEMTRFPEREAESVVAVAGDRRRTARVPVPEGVFVEVNRESMLLVNCSLFGVQLITTRRLLLEQHVQLLLPGIDVGIGGRVLWCRLEPVGCSGLTQYRVGVEYEAPRQFESVLKQFEADLGSLV
jgi:hypothetical protein